MKKMVMGIVFVLFIIFATWFLYLYLIENSNNVQMQIGKDSYQYTYWDGFKDNRWDLFINDNYVSFVVPFEGFSKKEMKEHLANEQLIKCLFDEENIRIYGLPWVQYGSKYKFIYTIDAKKFYSYSDDYAQYDSDPDAKQRLDKLYEKYPKDEIKKRAEETWE
ncbi:MAG: hypothetical protein J6C32_11880 [Eubacterium sp.]|nr:hypothetical protein [Eubacterium sp.]